MFEAAFFWEFETTPMLMSEFDLLRGHCSYKGRGQSILTFQGKNASQNSMGALFLPAGRLWKMVRSRNQQAI